MEDGPVIKTEPEFITNEVDGTTEGAATIKKEALIEGRTISL